ncbi:carboxylating nicotinate-nucleotide diphosphorylase [bacterium]|nr:carboxylating nicotinate-nucleotide diphosphorylase [bacterium]
MLTGEYIERLVRAELETDIDGGDITSTLVLPPGTRAEGKIVAKQDGVIAGIEFAHTAFVLVDKNTHFAPLISDGDAVKKGDAIAEVAGGAVSVLSAERTALNFLGHLSGIATLTRKVVDMVAEYGTKILDTRKTTPGLRLAEKYAVRCGGGTNHRMGLYDMILVKDNHIAAAGGIENVLKNLYSGGKIPKGVPVEVEVADLEQLRIALSYPVDRIMLDNFTPEMVRRAMKIREEMGAKIPFECSGGITMDNVVSYARTGVEFISVGMLTHSARQFDLSLEVFLR